MFIFTSQLPNVSAIGISDVTPTIQVGTIANAVDPIQGGGTFIYLKASVANAVANLVTYSQLAGTTTLSTPSIRGPLAVAMSANAIGTYGWFQIGGLAVVTSVATTGGLKGYLGGGAGSIVTTVTATQGIDGCIAVSSNGTPGVGLAYYSIAFPFANNTG